MSVKNKTNKNYKRSQKGRSMVEMLGVLAIVGVLSVGGVYGYGVAMKKHKAKLSKVTQKRKKKSR